MLEKHDWCLKVVVYLLAVRWDPVEAQDVSVFGNHIIVPMSKAIFLADYRNVMIAVIKATFG